MGVVGLRSSISLSLVLHAFLFMACFLVLRNQTTILSPKRTTLIQMEPLSSEQIKKWEEKFRKQVVQTDQGNQVKEAPKKAFLGKTNQEVDIKSVNRHHNTVMGNGKTQSQETQHENASDLAKKEIAKANSALSKLGVAVIPSAKPTLDNRPKDERNWADQASAPQDYAKGVKESDHTALNTKEYVFYTYYQRIRQRLDRAWVPILREKLISIYKSGRHLASDMDHSTRVLVILNSAGEIVRVKIMGESGHLELDDAAVKAFNEAGPFPNPPHGIIESGEIQIPWEFVLRT